MLNFLQAYGKEIFSLLVPLITWILNVGLRARVKLQWGIPYQFTHLLIKNDAEGKKLPAITLHTASIFVMNSGRDTATDVQIVLNFRPHNFNLWPARPAEEHTASDGRFTLKLASFSPKEEIRLEMVSQGSELPIVVQIRSDQQVAEHIEVQVFRRLPDWFRRIIVLLIFAGIGSFAYWLVTLVQILVLKTSI